jgi:hypothetical protein
MCSHWLREILLRGHARQNQPEKLFCMDTPRHLSAPLDVACSLAAPRYWVSLLDRASSACCVELWTKHKLCSETVLLCTSA